MSFIAATKRSLKNAYKNAELSYKKITKKLVKRFPILEKRPVRISILAGVAVIILSEIAMVLSPFLVQTSYALGSAGSLLSPINQSLATHLTYDLTKDTYSFNNGQSLPTEESIQTGAQLITATAHQDAKKGITVSDPINKVDFTLTPKFGLLAGRQDGNRIVYPLANGSGWVVYTMQATGVKEDIILTQSNSDTSSYEYTLGIGDGLEARLEADGSIGVYGNTVLSGDVTTGSEADAALLLKARKAADKNTYLFGIPKPVVIEAGKKISKSATARYSLEGNTVKVNVEGLKNAQFPLSIDPSIYVATAQQFMQGNNETNINFNVDDQLIEKAHTTGARFNDWNSTLNLNTTVWKQGIAAAGGYIYTVGGVHPDGGTTSYTSPGSDTFVVPAGITSITVKVWGAGGGGGGGGNSQPGGDGGGGGYVESTLAVTPGETLTLNVGGGGAGGAFSSRGNDAGGGGGGGGYSSVYRSSTPLAIAAGGGGGGGGRQAVAGAGGGAGGGATGQSGGSIATSNGRGGTGGTPTTGGTAGTSTGNDGANGSSLNGGDGGDGRTNDGADGSGATGGSQGGGNGGLANVNNTRAGGGGGGGGLFGGAGGGATSSTTTAAGGGGGGGSSYITGSGTSNTGGSDSTPGNSSDSDRASAADGGGGGAALGAGTAGDSGIIVVSYTGTVAAVDTVSWAKFNTSTGTIESANPGNGVCSGWCTSTSYNLPSPRGALSLVAYNGFLYAIGGEDTSCTTANGTGDGGVCKTVYVAKIGANGEPQLWHPTDTNKNNWVYWYRDTDINIPRSFTAAVASNNHIYLLGGKTSSGGTPSVTNNIRIADIVPTGTLSNWSTSATSLPYNVYSHDVQVYNDRLYLIGGASSIGGAPLSSIYYNKLNSGGTLNNWVQTTSLATGVMSNGGGFTTVWGGYLYVTGGCSAVNGSGYCTSVASITQLASINADGTIDTWNINGTLSPDSRMGHGLIAWRNYIYEIGGCASQNTTTGICSSALNTINFGIVNQDGDASTVDQSVSNGTAPCSGGSPTNCNLPGTGNVGNLLTNSVITNGYLYVIGGCTNNTCTTGNVSGNVAYVAISSTGTMTKPATCPNGSYQGGTWCVDNVNTVSGGVAAASPVVFNGTMYLVGGLNGANKNTINRTTLNSDGSIGAWTSQSMTGLGATSVSYLYAFARANPASAGTNPGNLYILGGCATSSGIGCTAYSQGVYKCNIQTAGTIASCSTSGQLQIGTLPGDTATGLGIMSGTVYANYIYLIGGVSPNQVDLTTVIYAQIDTSNNIVSVPTYPTGSTLSSTGWVQSPNQMEVGRRRASAFGYNGYIYVVGGYDGSGGGVLADIEFVKVNVSDGSLGSSSEGFHVSAVTINQRWGLNVSVSNSYAYVIGGCTIGNSPTCTAGSPTDVIQTFQIYNNDSGAPAEYTTSANSYTTDPNRIGVASTIYNGYIYAAGGCTGTSDCTSATTNVSYAPIDAQGQVGSWSSTSAALPAGRAWGKLLTAGNSLYYVGGQDSDGIPQSNVYYATPSSGNVSSWSNASNGLPGARTRFGATVWNNRLYVVGGNSSTQNTVVYNTAGSGTFTVPTGVTSLVVKAWGAGGGGGNGGASTGIGGGGGGGGFAQSTLTVTPGTSLTYNVGSGGLSNSTARYAGNGGGFTALLNGATYLIQAGGGGGGGGTTGTANGGQGGAGGGTSGTAGTAGSGTATVGGGGGAGTTAAGGAGGTAGTTGVAGNSGNANNGGDGGGSITSCTTAVTGRGGNGGTGAGGKGGVAGTCVNGGGGGGGRFGGGGGGSATNAAVRGGGGGGGGSSLVTGASTTQTAGSAGAAGAGGAAANNTDIANNGTAGKGGDGSTNTGSTDGQPGLLTITYGTTTPQSTVYVSPQLNSGGNISSAWSSSSTSFNVARISPSVTAYANNLYLLGGYDGTNYLSDTQYSKINGSTGNAGSWTYSESLPAPIAGGEAFAANGYVYVVGGRSSDTTCDPVTLVAPVSANTTISSGNNPTGIGAWYVTNKRYTGSRYGGGVVYNDGKLYVLGGACGASTLTYASPVTQQTSLLSQPQVAKYSIMIDTDSDVFPTKWLLNGVDNSIGAYWQLKYQSMTNTITSCTSPAMTTWGTTTNFGNVTLGLPGTYTPLNGSGVNTNCARFYYFNVTVDSSQAYGYPDDVTRGPTITDLTLQFTADPSKRLLHGRTFTGGLQQPIDTPYYSN